LKLTSSVQFGRRDKLIIIIIIIINCDEEGRTPPETPPIHRETIRAIREEGDNRDNTASTPLPTRQAAPLTY